MINSFGVFGREHINDPLSHTGRRAVMSAAVGTDLPNTRPLTLLHPHALYTDGDSTEIPVCYCTSAVSIFSRRGRQEGGDVVLTKVRFESMTLHLYSSTDIIVRFLDNY